MGYGNSGLAGAEWRSQLPPKYQAMDAFAYNYGVDFTPLPASLTQTGNITINTDADFVILATVAVVTAVTNLTRLTFVPQMVQMSDTGSGASFFNQSTHFHNAFGTAEDPCIWRQPRVIDRGSTLTVTLQNQEAVDRNVRLFFCGAKLYAARG
jgi:hypothetical protein